MEYTVSQLAAISGVSPRTLRYYDEIGLLKPERVSEGGYRLYAQAQVDRLQQILFFRELEMSLKEIRNVLASSEFDQEQALKGHLLALQQKKERLEALIANVNHTIRSLKGEVVMRDEEKFEGFKRRMLQENEETYGKELRENFGEETMEAANEKFGSMSEEQWKEQRQLEEAIKDLLRQAVETGNPAGPLAMEVCELHRKWLCLFWPDGIYSKEAHRNMGEMYAADERFRAYYDQIAPGATDFLRDALAVYYEEDNK
ncbi:MerR family transcriptional regulator [Hominifimenecus sp. rT4P-3]|uniref:MerR family transcriptional regulator n=1 Tax=Hominifimenecus sp. rT4P-3 TaxID=3242979 RepID=UPI003DA656F9